jgi:hypothetical protein
MIHSLLKQRKIHSPGNIFLFIAFLLFAFSLFLLLYALNLTSVIPALLTFTLVYVVVCALLFREFLILLPVVPVVAGVLIGAAGAALLRRKLKPAPAGML